MFPRFDGHGDRADASSSERVGNALSSPCGRENTLQVFVSSRIASLNVLNHPNGEELALPGANMDDGTRGPSSSSSQNVQLNAASTKLLGGITGKGFLPGRSGNPGGVPKNKPITEIYEEFLANGRDREAVKTSVRAMIKKKSNVTAIMLREMADRVEGRVSPSEDEVIDRSITVNIISVGAQ